ncbi:SMI1/KNR4 family protein [Nocardia sp. NPDC004582]
MTAIDDLRSLLPVPPSVSRPAIDWVAVEHRLGIPLPEDYRQLAGSYGESEFSSIVRLSVPDATSPSADLEWWIKDARERLENPDLPLECDDIPAGFALNPAALTAWGRLADGGYCLWDSSDADPNTWPVVIGSKTHTRWGFYRGTATQFLTALLTESLPAGRLFDEFADMVDEFGAYCDFYHEGRKIERVTAA